MTRLPQSFDPRQIAPNTGPQNNLPVSPPEGHVVTIINSEISPTSNNQGQMLVLHLQIQGGANAGAEGVYRLNLFNPSAEAMRIAAGQLSAICHCIGHLQPVDDVSVLYNKPFRVHVRIQPNKDGLEKGYTEIFKVCDLNGNKPGQQGAGQAAPQQPQAPQAPQQPQYAPQAPQGFAPPPAAPQQQFAPPPQQGFPPPGQAPNPAAAPWAQQR